jgi:hypothetical protein
VIGDIVYRRAMNPDHRESFGGGYWNPNVRPVGHPWCHTQDVNHMSISLTREVYQHYDHDVAGLIVLADWQGNMCAVCGHKRKLIKEHDHDTDLIRGLVCPSCNARESYSKNYSSAIEDFPDSDLTIRRYLRMPPTRMLGLMVHYSRTRNVDPTEVVSEWYRQDAQREIAAAEAQVQARLIPSWEPLTLPRDHPWRGK